MNQTFCDLKGIDHKGNGITSFNGWIIFSLAVEIENISLIHSKKMINRTKKKNDTLFFRKCKNCIYNIGSNSLSGAIFCQWLCNVVYSDLGPDLCHFTAWLYSVSQSMRYYRRSTRNMFSWAVTKHDSWNSWKRRRWDSKTQQLFESTNRSWLRSRSISGLARINSEQ